MPNPFSEMPELDHDSVKILFWVVGIVLALVLLLILG